MRGMRSDRARDVLRRDWIEMEKKKLKSKEGTSRTANIAISTAVRQSEMSERKKKRGKGVPYTLFELTKGVVQFLQ